LTLAGADISLSGMAKYLLLLLMCWHLQLARGENNLLQMAERGYYYEDFKRQIDATPPEAINSLVSEEGKTALALSAAGGHQQGVALLLLAGADANARDKSGRSPAFGAVSHEGEDYLMILEMLALARADLNAKDGENITLLAAAAQAGNLPAVRLLLLLGADSAPNDVPGEKKPLFFALSRQDAKMADLLSNAAAGKETNATDKSLATAARAAKLGSISAALAAGADINQRDEAGTTALYRAVSEQRASVVALLLLNGANPNLALPDGKTPLMESMRFFDMAGERMTLELIVAGADVNATAKDGATALSQAVHTSNNFGAQWMIWRGANLDVHSPDGTLMQGASLNPDWPSMIELLKRAGLSEEESPMAQKKEFILFQAVRSGDPKAVEAELQNGTPVDIVNRYDQTALEWAVCYDRFDIVDLLLRRGADINHQHHYNGEHIIHILARRKDSPTNNAAKLIEQLVKRGANPNLVTHDGATPLMVAARNGVTGPSTEVLLQVTADINARDKQGLTALGLARQHGHSGMVKMLQAKGARE
jgi:ankyrin repeat protein